MSSHPIITGAIPNLLIQTEDRTRRDLSRNSLLHLANVHLNRSATEIVRRPPQPGDLVTAVRMHQCANPQTVRVIILVRLLHRLLSIAMVARLPHPCLQTLRVRVSLLHPPKHQDVATNRCRRQLTGNGDQILIRRPRHRDEEIEPPRPPKTGQGGTNYLLRQSGADSAIRLGATFYFTEV